MLKKAISLCAAGLALVGALSACARADAFAEPNVSRDAEQMIATAALPVGTAAGQTLRETLGAPERVEETLPTQMEKFSIMISADVSVPDADHLSVYRVSAANFSLDMVKRVYSYFCADTDMYDYGNLFHTKKQLKARIDSMQRDLETNDSPDGPNGGDSWRADYKAEITGLMTELLTARDDLGDPISEVRFTREQTEGDGVRESFQAVNTPNMPCNIEFYAINNVAYPTNEMRYIEKSDTTVAPRSEAGLYYYDTRRVGGEAYKLRDVTNETSVRELSMTPREALDRVADLFKTLGIADMKPVSVALTSDSQEANGRHYSYCVEACRVVDGVQVQSPFHRTYVGSIEDGHEWAYETLEVRLDDEGIVNMSWLSPLTVGAVEVERANLLPFSSILTVAKNMLFVANEPRETDLSNYDAFLIQIDRITLSLQRIPNANSVVDGVLIPVWNFYGQEGYTLSGGVEMHRLTSESIGLDEEPYLSINAIDGSVINKTLGY